MEEILATKPSFLSSSTEVMVALTFALLKVSVKTLVIALFRKSGLKTFPTAVLGNSVKISTCFGKAAFSFTVSLQNLSNSSGVTLAPSTNSTYTHGSSPAR